MANTKLNITKKNAVLPMLGHQYELWYLNQINGGKLETQKACYTNTQIELLTKRSKLVADPKFTNKNKSNWWRFTV